MLEVLIAGCIGALGGGAVYLFMSQENTGYRPPSIGDVSALESNLIRMARALIDEWNTHKKKRSGLVLNGDTEFILTIRRPIVKEEEPVYVPEPINNTVVE